MRSRSVGKYSKFSPIYAFFRPLIFEGSFRENRKNTANPMNFSGIRNDFFLGAAASVPPRSAGRSRRSSFLRAAKGDHDPPARRSRSGLRATAAGHDPKHVRGFRPAPQDTGRGGTEGIRLRRTMPADYHRPIRRNGHVLRPCLRKRRSSRTDTRPVGAGTRLSGNIGYERQRALRTGRARQSSPSGCGGTHPAPPPDDDRRKKKPPARRRAIVC